MLSRISEQNNYLVKTICGFIFNYYFRNFSLPLAADYSTEDIFILKYWYRLRCLHSLDST